MRRLGNSTRSKQSYLAIRADAGGKTGFGHIVRSLALARYLRDQYRIETIFYSNPYGKLGVIYKQNGFEYVFNQGFSEVDFLRRIAQDPSSLVLFIDKLFPYGRNAIGSLRDDLKIVMFHNECAGMYECDCVVFPSAHLSNEVILDPRWSESRAQLFYGPDYVIINESVISIMDQEPNGKADPYIAVTTGASDPKGMMLRIIEWVNKSELEMPVKALYGFDFCHKPDLDVLSPELRSNIEIKKFNYSDLFSARLAIAAFGVTTYELIYANVPVITIGHIRKNAIGSKALQERYGCNYHLGLFEEVTETRLISAIWTLWNEDEKLTTIKRNQKGLIDGKGLDRLGQIISSCYKS